jgi:hypothetical protein
MRIEKMTPVEITLRMGGGGLRENDGGGDFN